MQAWPQVGGGGVLLGSVPCTGLPKEPSSQTRTKCLGLPPVAYSHEEQLVKDCPAEARG